MEKQSDLMPTAVELMNDSHALSAAFKSYCGNKGVVPSKRQAREYLQRLKRVGMVRSSTTANQSPLAKFFKQSNQFEPIRKSAG